MQISQPGSKEESSSVLSSWLASCSMGYCPEPRGKIWGQLCLMLRDEVSEFCPERNYSLATPRLMTDRRDVFLFSSQRLPFLWWDLSAFCFLSLTSCFLWVEFFCCYKTEAFYRQWNKDFLFSLVSREGKYIGAVSHGSRTSACKKDFTLCFAFFSPFPESSVGVSSRTIRNYILIPFSPYPSSRVGNAAFGSWKYSARKRQNESQSAPCCCVPMNINAL